jgi:RNA polymerase sigma-70 factor (ECF subfamily)
MQSVAVRPTRSATTLAAPVQEAAVKRISSEDANARFKSVVLPHLDDAYALARWLTGSRADSEDVVQDACLRALRGIGGFSHGNARAWVLTIVRHTTYSWLHTNRPAAVVLVEDFEGIERTHSTALDAETPETALIAQEDGTLLETAIAALPAPLRETLVLREIQGLSYREIAEVTEVSIGTVMSRLARARGRVISIMRTAEVRPN